MNRLLTILILSLFFFSGSAKTTQVCRPMLDPNIAVPNGGIFRTWDGSIDGIKIINIFNESPYRDTSNLLYCRYDWCMLETDENKYDFNRIESLMQKAIKGHQRIIIGLAFMDPDHFSTLEERDGRQIATPIYIYDEAKKSRYPFIKDELHCKNGYSPDYHSPFLFKRYKSLLKAFSKWLEGNVAGSNIKRKNVIYGIEMRYAGYWGEGPVNKNIYPDDARVLDSYMNLYPKYFPDILLIAGGGEAHHCPNYASDNIGDYTKSQIAAMRHYYHLLNIQNKCGKAGLFIDSWSIENRQNSTYDSIGTRVIIDDHDNVIRLYDYQKKYLYGQRYITGEFDYFVFSYNKQYLPYMYLGEQFTERHVSGITLSNMSMQNAAQYENRKEEIINNTRKIMPYTGYRVVLGNVVITGRKLSFILANIGISRIFHDYYQLHLIVRDFNGKEIYDYPSNFDFKTLNYCKGRPLTYYGQDGKRLTFTLPAIKGKVYVIVKDKYGIEYPMTLSNYGRQKDGSYYIGNINY